MPPLFLFYRLSDGLNLLIAVGGWLGNQKMYWQCRIMFPMLPTKEETYPD